ncbi:conserved hypothetical protein [Vibrio rotiferianus]|nr:conserved hypothetical protein [Vibrio rotiferianus]CAH1569617.1 conserved hypothetical protein [Vibrio rotiferianus]
MMYPLFTKLKRIKTHFLKAINELQNIELKYTQLKFTKYKAKK